MKRTIFSMMATLFLLVMIAPWLTGCGDEPKEIKSQIVIDKIYEEEYTYLMPQTIIIAGHPVVVSIPKTVPESWYVRVQVTYIDNSIDTKKVQVTQAIYKRTEIGSEWKG